MVALREITAFEAEIDLELPNGEMRNVCCRFRNQEQAFQFTKSFQHLPCTATVRPIQVALWDMVEQRVKMKRPTGVD